MFTIMATEENQNRVQDTHSYACLSADTKQTTGVRNGSLCIEMDTGDIYAYDEENEEWLKIITGETE